MPKLLGRADILGAKDRVHKDVLTPEWKKDSVVRVQSMTGTERDDWEELCQVAKVGAKAGEKEFSTKQLREKLLSFCLVDAEGKRIFSEGDLALLAAKNSAALTRLFDVARKLSGIGAQDVEDLVKNSEPAPSESST